MLLLRLIIAVCSFIGLVTPAASAGSTALLTVVSFGRGGYQQTGPTTGTGSIYESTSIDPLLAPPASVALGEVTSNGVTATIRPDATELGKSANISIAARYEGKLYSKAGENWTLNEEGALTVAVHDITLSTAMPITVVSGLDVSKFPGIELFLGYGIYDVSTNELFSSLGKMKQVYPETSNGAVICMGISVPSLSSKGQVLIRAIASGSSVSGVLQCPTVQTSASP